VRRGEASNWLTSEALRSRAALEPTMTTPDTNQLLIAALGADGLWPPGAEVLQARERTPASRTRAAHAKSRCV
jgi:hypothetical protein